MARQSTGRPAGRPRAGNPVYPVSVEGIMESALALRSLIEEAQAISRDTSQRPALRRDWQQAADELEEALDALLNCCRRQAQSHQREIAGHQTEYCQRYTEHEPSAGALDALGKLQHKARATRHVCTGCGQCASPAPTSEMVGVAAS